jgi:FtsZ-interacting cell division protein ZipA
MIIRMNLELDTDDMRDRSVLAAINAALNATSSLTTQLINHAPQAATVAAPTKPTPPADQALKSYRAEATVPDVKPVVVAKPTVSAEPTKPSHTDTLIPATPVNTVAQATAEPVQATAEPVQAAETAASVSTPAATSSPASAPIHASGVQPTKEDMMAIFEKFVRAPKVGGPKALAGILARYGDASVPTPTALSGPTALPIHQYGPLKAELEHLIALAGA